MDGRPALDIAGAQCTAVLKLPAREDQALLVRWNALLVLDLLLGVCNGTRRIEIEDDGLACDGLDEDWHPHPAVILRGLVIYTVYDMELLSR